MVVHVTNRRRHHGARSSAADATRPPLLDTMESLFGITGKGFTIIASDNNAARSIIKMKSDDDKQKVLSNHLVMTYAGESGTCIAITGRGEL